MKKDKKTENKKSELLSKWFKDHLTLIAVFLIILIFSAVFLRDAVIKTIDFFRENKKLSGQLLSLSSKKKLLDELDEAELEKSIEVMEKIFPSKKPSLGLLASLSTLADRENVIFSGIKLSPGRIEEMKREEIVRAKTPEKGKLNDFSVEFSVEGKLTNVSSFISALEKTAPIIKIESFNLQLTEERMTGLYTGNVQVDLKVYVFYQEPPEEIGPVEQPLPQLTSEEREFLSQLSQFETESFLLPGVPVGQETLFGPAH